MICSLFTYFLAIIHAEWSDIMVGQMRQSEADFDLPITFQLPQLSYYDILEDV